MRQAWRILTSMRTALVLLFSLALAAVPGSMLPQYPASPFAVRQWYDEHPRLAPVVDALGGFDVFASPLFLTLYVLLGISLVGCLTPRIRTHWRALRSRPPRTPRYLDRLPEHASATVAAAPAEVLDAAARRLRGWRVDRHDGSLSAEKGYARETGNLLFHLCLLALLAAVAAGWLYGYDGRMLVVEGETFTSTRLAYDELKPGRRFDPSDLPPFTLRLEDFRASYLANGQPSSFAATVDWAPDLAAPPRRADVRVNHPLDVAGARVYLIDHGYAPVVVVRDGSGRVLRSGPTPCLPEDSSLVSTCVVKVPDVTRGPQLGIRGAFFPTIGLTAGGAPYSQHPEARAPAMSVEVFAGDLGLDSGLPQSVYELDTSRLTPTNRALLLPGRTVGGLPGGATVTFEGYREWASFQVTRDPGKGAALAAAVAMIVGIGLSLRVRRRRLWVRATGEPGATLVEVGGLARSQPDAFHREFSRIVEEMGLG
jgi:cytochrome c biogenesis protein